MILLIDGIRMVGKTTLAEHIYQDLSLQFVGLETFDLMDHVPFKEISQWPSDIDVPLWEEWESRITSCIHRSVNEDINMILDGGPIAADFHHWKCDVDRVDALLARADTFMIFLTESPVTIINRMLAVSEGRHMIGYSRDEIIAGHRESVRSFRTSQIQPKGSFLVTQFLTKDIVTGDSFTRTDHYKHIIRLIKKNWTKGETK